MLVPTPDLISPDMCQLNQSRITVVLTKNIHVHASWMSGHTVAMRRAFSCAKLPICWQCGPDHVVQSNRRRSHGIYCRGTHAQCGLGRAAQATTCSNTRAKRSPLALSVVGQVGGSEAACFGRGVESEC